MLQIRTYRDSVMMNRREVLAASGALALGMRRAQAPPAGIESIQVVSRQPSLYHGWPTLAKRRSGQLLLVCSGGREAHVCPFGRVELMTSDDGGRSWSWPRVVLDGAIDDRDAGVLETCSGAILITSFSSLAFEPVLKQGEEQGWPAERLDRWRAARDRLPQEARQKELGCWAVRSTDGGLSWSARIDTGVNSPHGPVQLADGRLLYMGKELWTSGRIGAAESTDDGRTWKWIAEVPARQGDDPKEYHELHAVQTGDGRIVAQIRNHNPANGGETLQTESADGGKTWSAPRAIGVWGLPSHLLRLRDGRLLMSTGHRRPPFGNQARVSADHGRTWSEPIVLSGDGAGGDLGYPSTAELDDGTLVTVWYEKLKSSEFAVLRQVRWRL
jgi:hypothetical protein